MSGFWKRSAARSVPADTKDIATLATVAPDAGTQTSRMDGGANREFDIEANAAVPGVELGPGRRPRCRTAAVRVETSVDRDYGTRPGFDLESLTISANTI